MPRKFDFVHDAMVGRRIDAIEARPVGTEVELAAIVLDDGSRVLFNKRVGSSNHTVGVRVELAVRPTLARRA